MFLQRHSIRTIFPLFLVMIALATAAGIFVLTNSFYIKSNKKGITDVLQLQARQESAILSYQLNSAGKTAANLADMTEAMPVYDQARLFQEFDEKLSMEKLLFGIGIWLEPDQFRPGQKYYGPYMYRNQHDENVLTWEYSTPSYDYLSWGWYRDTREDSADRPQIHLSPVYYDSVLDTFFITTSVPIFRQGKFAVVASADISIREIAAYVKNIKVGYQGYAFLLTPNGFIVGKTPFIGGNRLEDEFKNLSESLDLANPAQKEYLQLAASVREQSSGLLQLAENDEMAAFAQVGDTGLSLVLVYPEKELYGFFNQTLGYYLLLFCGVVLSFFFITRLILRKTIEKPIAQLLDRVSRVMKGDFSQDGKGIPIGQSRNEFDILGQAMNKMAASLEGLVRDLNYQNSKLMRSRREIAVSEEKYRLIFEASSEGLWEMDLSAQRRSFSERWLELFAGRLGDSKLEDMNCWYQLVHPDDRHKATAAYEAICSGREDTVHCEYRILAVDGSYLWVAERAKSLKDPYGKPCRIAGAHQDITREKLDEENIRHLAYFDALTNLPNRAYFDEQLGRVIGECGQERFAVFFMDLDNFKVINDTAGHGAGDQVLLAVSRRLQGLADKKIWVSRFGGDEFILIARGIADRTDCEAIADAVHHLVNQPIFIEDTMHFVNVSIGIAMYPEDGTNADQLLRNADIAMFAGKESGRDQSVFYESRMNEAIIARSSLEHRLRLALDREEFVLHFQPLYHLRQEGIIGFEALVRWNSPGEGLVPPGRFIQVMEENRLINPLGKWVLNEACRFISRLLTEDYPHLRVSVNVSVIQMRDKDFSETVLKTLEKHGVPAANLEIEITESKLMEFYGDCIDNIRRLRAAGVRVAIDDFGSGYSSFSYLTRLPISALKIDRSFIENMSRHEEAALAELIILVAHKMDLEVVAEGVETEAQYLQLKKFGCDILQGYLISRPVPAAAALASLEDSQFYQLTSAV